MSPSQPTVLCYNSPFSSFPLPSLQDGIPSPRAWISANVVSFLPFAGHGYVYGTNRGHLQICHTIGDSPRDPPSRDHDLDLGEDPDLPPDRWWHAERRRAERRRALFHARRGGAGSSSSAAAAGSGVAGFSGRNPSSTTTTSMRDRSPTPSDRIPNRASERSGRASHIQDRLSAASSSSSSWTSRAFRSRPSNLLDPWTMEVSKSSSCFFLSFFLLVSFVL